MSKTIAIIPARGGSKRLPGKNLLPLNEIPLLAHSIITAMNNGFINEIYVTTDSEAIAETALHYGAQVVSRPKEISGDLSTTVSALKHVLEKCSYNGSENVILLQPTNPLRPKNLLKDAFNRFTDGNYQSLFTVSPNRQKFGKIANDKFIPYNYEYGQRSQDLEPLFYENGLLYISKASLIVNDILLSPDAFPYIIEHPFAEVDIDLQSDFEYAQYLLNKHINEL